MDDIRLSDNRDAHRFELHKDGVLAGRAEYNLLKGAVMFTHTEVSPQFEGQGLASKLAAFALDDVRKQGLQVIPVCQYIAGYIRKHPQYRNLLSEEQRRAFRI